MVSKIIAIGGGGFSMEPDNPLLDLYCLSCTGKKLPKVCFVGTASGDSEDYIARFEAAFSRYDCDRSLLAFFRKPAYNTIPLANIEAHLRQQDLIYVGGGNTQGMLAVWREWELDKILRSVWQSGVVLAGISAGALCWFDYGGSDSTYVGRLSPLRGIGLLPGSCTPHYSNEPNRRPDVHQLMQRSDLPAGIGIDDGVAVLFEGQKLAEAVASRPNAKAYQVQLKDGKVVESSLPIRQLEPTSPKTLSGGLGEARPPSSV